MIDYAVLDAYASERMRHLLEPEHWAKVVSGEVPCDVYSNTHWMRLHVCGLHISWDGNHGVSASPNGHVVFYGKVNAEISEQFKTALLAWRDDLKPPLPRQPYTLPPVVDVIADAEAERARLDCPEHKAT